ncbi:MAG: ABC transporter substrate-binding protein, partial [Oscillospiraceae bacterium]|nr:ABC transporter substrate-binding protein [Oscillospiraceae bacterium]
MKRVLALVLAGLILFVAAVGCGREEPSVAEIDFNDFDAVLEAARGTTVTFFGWGGSAATNGWLDNVVAPSLYEQYGVTLSRVPMDIDGILSKLMGEKQAGVTTGDIDVVWINGENFYTAKTGDLL